MTIRNGSLLLSLALAAATAASEPILPLTVEVRSRDVAPGEPLRIVAATSEPLRTLTGTFLGESFTLTRVDADEERERWSGWTMVPLDHPGGLAAVELQGNSRRGRSVAATLALTVEQREFPEEQLSVAPRYVNPPAEIERRLERERAKLAAIYRARDEPLRIDAPFVRPVDGPPTSIFGMRRIYNGEPRSPHPGLDLRAATGTAVRCSGPGRVVLAEELYYSGNTVIVDHGGGLFTLYAHLSELLVEPGAEASADQLIGRAGATGRVTGAHLHWGAKIGDRPVDPTALLDPALFGE